MTRSSSGRFRFLIAACALLALAGSASAQSTGMVKGKVVDDKGQPVEGAKITIDFLEGVNRRQETKSNKQGEFIQIGLFPGSYKVTAEKEKLGSQSFDVRVRSAQTAGVNFQLIPGQTAGPTKEEAAKLAELRKVFDEGVQQSRAGSYDQAIATFQKALEVRADCADCYYNIGYAYTQKKEYDKAEAAYKKAVEIKADYPEAYNGLATIYNAQRRFDEAAAVSAKATQSGSAGGSTSAAGVDAIYNQGVILWNAGKLSEAKKQFEAALQANPNHAESHYQLGMALISEGNMAAGVEQFESYLKLAPDGPNAAQAKAAVSALKK